MPNTTVQWDSKSLLTGSCLGLPTNNVRSKGNHGLASHRGAIRSTRCLPWVILWSVSHSRGIGGKAYRRQSGQSCESASCPNRLDASTWATTTGSGLCFPKRTGLLPLYQTPTKCPELHPGVASTCLDVSNSWTEHLQPDWLPLADKQPSATQTVGVTRWGSCEWAATNSPTSYPPDDSDWKWLTYCLIE